MAMCTRDWPGTVRAEAEASAHVHTFARARAAFHTCVPVGVLWATVGGAAACTPRGAMASPALQGVDRAMQLAVRALVVTRALNCAAAHA